MCTGIAMKSRENHYFWGRTQEYNLEMPYSGIIVPRDMDSMLSLTPFKTKYAVLGVSAYYVPMIIDGVNEKGLAGGTFYFGNYNRYGKEEAIRKAGKKPMRPEDIIFYILSNYETVKEIKERLNDDIAIADTVNIQGVSLPQHCVFQDVSGESVVIEPSTEGRFDLYDNPVGIFTNSPKFDWHLINLQNYVGLSNKIDPGILMGDFEIFTNGKGNGLRGIPGDFTPQSRFVRAAYLKEFSNTVPDEKAIDLLFHLLNSFDIPKGVVEVGGPEDLQYTQYTSAYDLEGKAMVIHTYDNRHLQVLKMKEKYMTGDRCYYFDLQERPQVVEMGEIDPKNLPNFLK